MKAFLSDRGERNWQSPERIAPKLAEQAALAEAKRILETEDRTGLHYWQSEHGPTERSGNADLALASALAGFVEG